ncbi:MAG: hypothetical protein IPJ65_32710 [Archangiaceae bacterium]|nr:hypothetical protein [Archangiaceae bacterium]
MRPRGQMTISTWLFIIAALGVLYAAVVYVPPFVDNMSVKEAVEVAFLRGFTSPDDIVVQDVTLKLNGGPTAVGYHYETDESGVVTEVPGLGIPPEGVVVTRDEGTRTMTISVDYDRVVKLKPTNKYKTIHFHIEKSRDFR